MERVPAHDVLIAVFYLNGENACTQRFNCLCFTSIERVPTHGVLITVCDLNGDSAWTRRFNNHV